MEIQELRFGDERNLMKKDDPKCIKNNLLKSLDHWVYSADNKSGKMSSSFVLFQDESGGDGNVVRRHLSCENILDYVPNSRNRQFHDNCSNRPRSVGTDPGKAKLFSPNASGPCLLSSLSHGIPAISTHNTPSRLSDNEASEDIIVTNSLDSGIPVESLSMMSQVKQYQTVK